MPEKLSSSLGPQKSTRKPTATSTALPDRAQDPLDHSIKAHVDALVAGLEEMKAEDIVLLDLKGKTIIADVMLVASGRSHVHVSAIARRLEEVAHQRQLTVRLEGIPACDWVLVDCGDVIVHIFRPEVRHFYRLEDMWSINRPLETNALPIPLP